MQRECEEGDRVHDLDGRVRSAAIDLIHQMTDGETAKTQAYIFRNLAEFLGDEAKVLLGEDIPPN